MVRYFADEKSAKALAAEKHVELLERGTQKWRANRRRTACHRFCSREAGISLKDAIEHYLAHVESLNHSATIETAVEEFLSIREAEGKSQVHLADLRHRLNRFVRAHGTRLAASINIKELDGWLHGLDRRTSDPAQFP